MIQPPLTKIQTHEAPHLKHILHGVAGIDGSITVLLAAMADGKIKCTEPDLHANTVYGLLVGIKEQIYCIDTSLEYLGGGNK